MERCALRNLNGLALELRLPIEWLSSEADAARIPCLRIGRRRLFNIDAVRHALADRAATANCVSFKVIINDDR